MQPFFENIFINVFSLDKLIFSVVPNFLDRQYLISFLGQPKK